MKNNILKTIIVLLFAVLLLGGMPVQAEEVNQKFEIDYGTLYRYNGNDTEIVIPDGVESINTAVFEGNTTITSVVIPDSVTYIGENAFYKCINLEKVTLPTKLPNIASMAFDDTLWLDNLRKLNPLVVINGILIDGKACVGAVTIPKDVTAINDSAFTWNESITSVEFSENITKIGTGAFSFCNKLKSITIPENIKSISRYAFSSCSSLKNMTFLGVTLLSGEGIFDDCDSGLTIYGLNNSYTKEQAKEYGYKFKELAFNKTTSSLVIGSTINLKMNNDGKVTGWKSSNSKVATVKNGKVTAKLAGTSTITGEYGGKSYECDITVKELAFDKTKATLVVGKTLTLKMTNDGKVTAWKSSNSKVATVKNGKVTAKSAGTTTITGEHEGKTYKCVISVKEPAFNMTKATLEIGNTLTLKMTDDGKVTAWKSSNKKIATVKDGKITAKATGTVTISGKYNGKTYKCIITIKEPTPKIVETPIQVKEGYLTEKQLTDKINSLIKKYPKVDKSHIKIRVIGANLDYIDDNVLYSILNISSYTELKKYADDYYKAMDKSFETAFFTRAHLSLGAEKRGYLYKDDLRLSDLFFDKNLIKHSKFFDSLLMDMTTFYDKREKSADAGVNLLAYFFDTYFEEYFDYKKVEVYKFGDKNVGYAASYAIDYYSLGVLNEVGLAESYSYSPYRENEDAKKAVKEYTDNQINPFIVRMNNIKKLEKNN